MNPSNITKEDNRIWSLNSREKLEIREVVLDMASEDALLSPEERQDRAESMQEFLDIYPNERHRLMAAYMHHLAEHQTDPGSAQATKFEAKEPEPNTSVAVDFSKIGWLSGSRKDGPNTKDVGGQRIVTPELTYDLVNLAKYDRVNNDYYEKATRTNPKIEEKVEKVVPQLWESIISGQGRHRPISVSSIVGRAVDGKRALNTTYPAYKVDVNGSNNRAVILMLGRAEDGTPQFGLAALYKHEDQSKVLGKMYLRKYSGK